MKIKKAVIIRMGGEIGIKSSFVRGYYESLVRNHIIELLKENKIKIDNLLKAPGRLYIFTEENEKAALLSSKVFGVSSTSPCFVSSSNKNEIIEIGIDLALKNFKKGSFAIRCSRSGIHPYKSKDIEIELGREILKRMNNLSVNLDNPDQVLYIEIRDENAFFYFNYIKGPDGFPIGTQEPLIGIINEKKSSVISSWCIMRRGSLIKALVIEINGEIPYEVKNNLKKLLEWIRKLEVIVVPVKRISNIRMIEILSAINLIEREDVEGVVSNIRSIEILKKFSKKPLFLPLLGLDNELIDEWSRFIGLGPYEEEEDVIEELVEEDIENIISKAYKIII
ncbi:MAG: THUMP domain-containing protein [Candidatus Verstraetearchaeota archaeon]|nr:THUMP domain-containing protein [Candidatus Verstraetearchaeota archaeon]